MFSFRVSRLWWSHVHVHTHTHTPQIGITWWHGGIEEGEPMVQNCSWVFVIATIHPTHSRVHENEDEKEDWLCCSRDSIKRSKRVECTSASDSLLRIGENLYIFFEPRKKCDHSINKYVLLWSKTIFDCKIYHKSWINNIPTGAVASLVRCAFAVACQTTNTSAQGNGKITWAEAKAYMYACVCVLSYTIVFHWWQPMEHKNETCKM